MITLDQLQAGLIIPIDKPRQWTSFQAVNKVKTVIRRLYGLKKFKIGHAGTLDPLATGLLLVCVGKATKLIPQLQEGTKSYTGTFLFGATTPCFDLEQTIDHYYPYQHITRSLVEQTSHQFIGTISQIPPMFSAIKIDGQRAYKYARLDDPSVQPQPKTITITRFDITGFRTGTPQPFSPTPIVNPNNSPSLHLYDNPQGFIPPFLPQADFLVDCSKGTYIRSLARDLGIALDSGAFLTALRRTQIGHFSIQQAIALGDIESFFQQPYHDTTSTDASPN